MRTLFFNVEGQQLSPEGDFSNIVKGSKGYLNCQFLFKDSNWTNCKVVAVFEKKGEFAVAVKSDGTCMIPDEVTDFKCFKLRLVGKKDNVLISTNRVLISQEG